jgi:hypothetical protein
MATLLKDRPASVEGFSGSAIFEGQKQRSLHQSGGFAERNFVQASVRLLST